MDLQLRLKLLRQAGFEPIVSAHVTCVQASLVMYGIAASPGIRGRGFEPRLVQGFWLQLNTRLAAYILYNSRFRLQQTRKTLGFLQFFPP